MSPQPTDGFTTVGAPARRANKPTTGVVFSAGNIGSQRRNVDTQNITVSNSFSSLRDDGITEDTTEEDFVVKENMENANPNLQVKKSKSVAHGKGVSSHVERNKSSKKVGSNNKTSGIGQSLVASGLRPRRESQSKSTRGLIFGPIGEDVELSSNGKRLRVEKSGLGRSGGSVVNSDDVRAKEAELQLQGQRDGQSMQLVGREEVGPCIGTF